MAEPRFQVRLVRRRPVTGEGLRATGPTAEVRASAGNGVLVWRLLGTNNRELGRSAIQFDSLDRCLQAIEEARMLAQTVDQPRISFTTREGGGYSWWWTVEREGARFISAARTFSRQRDCLANFKQFSINAAAASVTNSTPASQVYGAGEPYVARPGQQAQNVVSISHKGVGR